MMRLFLQFILLALYVLSAPLSVQAQLGNSSPAAKWNSSEPFGAQESAFLPVTEAYQPLLSLSESGLQLNWQITEGYYLYKERFATAYFSEGRETRVTPDYGDAIIKDDPYFGATPVYYDFANAQLSDHPPASFLLKLTAQGCADAGLCYPPHDWFFKVSPTSGEVVPTSAAAWDSAVNTKVQPTASQNIWLMLLFAVAGGVILNLMPCVFPVLGLKVLSFTQNKTGTAARHGAVYSAGVIASFLLIALALIAVKSAGAAVGWGFQLQTPWFVALLSCVFFVLSLNLFGLFEFSFIGSAPGQSLSQRSDYVGSFFTGVLATVVATPCTAPFMGTALGFAATQPAPVSLGIFGALGAGMALPVYLLTLFPGALKSLPRSGSWMEHLKQFLSFPLLATAIWLCWVIGRQNGVNAMGLTLVAWLALGLALWFYGLRSRLAHIMSVASLLVALAVLGSPQLNQDRTTRANGQSAVIQYSEDKLAELRSAGKPVFIDVTADWCITCKVNERVALHTDTVRQAFADKNVVYMVADWTRYDESITRLLEDYQRNGIPLYLLYRPGQERAEILPQFLSESLVLRALEDL